MERKRIKASAVIATTLIACLAIAPCANADMTSWKERNFTTAEQSGELFKSIKKGFRKKKDKKEQFKNMTDEEKETIKAERKENREENKDRFKDLTDEEKETIKAERKAKREENKDKFKDLTDKEKETFKTHKKANKGGGNEEENNIQ